MILKIYMEPTFSVPDRAEGGIRRVCEAMARYLPDHGIELVAEIRKADLTVGHGVMHPQAADKPFVSANHGLYWQDYDWPNAFHQINAEVVEGLVRAQAITAPSRWVAHAITRGVLRRPTVIHHGVDADEWAAPRDHDSSGYVLWNKARADPVSDPAPVNALARRMPDVKFVTTIGMPAANVAVTGVMPLPEMKPIIQRAGVYLATARETFGIGTLEALAAGIPVAGWDYGGQSEIVRLGDTGYLVPFGDFDALAASIRRCLAERDRLSGNAAADARERWGWRDKIAQYAHLFHETFGRWMEKRPAVSVIVTCHDLARFLPQALDSLLAQPFQDWECLIVDDASSDDTPQVSASYAARDSRFRPVRSEVNLKLCGALNLGAAESRGRYLVNLDADNWLTEDALTACARELDDNPDIHIAYGALDVVNAEGKERRRNAFPFGSFSWHAQMAHLNQIHSSAMQRREVWEETGGYRARMWRAEDAEHWCRATSFGFRAKQVTEHPTLVYRMRPDSKGALENRDFGGDGPWNEWFPWRLAATAEGGMRALREKRAPLRLDIVPFGAQAKHPRAPEFWPVYHHQAPLISVVIPLGPGHEKYVIDALDSLVAQDVVSWEAIVVNNTGLTLDAIAGAPYARIIDSPGVQVGAVRNAGAKAARGKFLYFLDADDYLRPGAFRIMLEAYQAGKASYLYSDYVEVGPDRSEKLMPMPEYRQGEWRGQHAINVLIARADFGKSGGFDESLAGWEDWDWFCKLSVAGLCGQRIPQPTFYYRKFTGKRRDDSFSRKDALLEQIRLRYKSFYDADGKTMTSCCPGNGDAVMAAKSAVERAWTAQTASVSQVDAPGAPPTSGITPQAIRLEYIGLNVGSIQFLGANGRIYRGGANPKDRFIDAHPDDVAKFVAGGRWKVVERRPPPPAPPPQIIPDAPIVPIQVEENHGDTESTEKTIDASRLRELRISVVDEPPAKPKRKRAPKKVKA